MLDIKNYILNLKVKLGFGKRESTGIKMRNSSDVTIKQTKISGVDKGIDADKVDGLEIEDTDIR